MRCLLVSFGLIFSLLLFPSRIVAQDSLRKSKSKGVSKISKVAEELKSSISKNDDQKTALGYEKLAEEFRQKGDNAKAEEYLKKAQAIYEKTNNNDNNSRVTRSLAKIQESQKKFGSAAKNYEKAGEIADKIEDENINLNDASRLRNASSPKAQAVLVQQKIENLENNNAAPIVTKDKEVVDAYKQQAEISLKQSDNNAAIVSYNKAIVYAKNKPEEIIKIKNEIAKTYVADNQLDKAISIHQTLLAEAEKNNDFNTQILQLQELSTIYFKQNQAQKGLNVLKNAYQLAILNGKTAEAKKCLQKLVTYYKSNDKESIALYADFVANFDQLIQKDTSLIDAKTFQITEEKIKQLEKEKNLKDELIAKKNTFNYFLISTLGLLLLLFGFIAKALFSIKRKNKEIALQSLRREMNPHFIFNSLNSVNQFISQNKEREANKYLTSYSNLMRNTMENSNKDFVTLANEVGQLKKYLDLEHLRFQDQFDFKIIIDENLDPETTFVPNMLIQPQLENAIWHGLRYLENKGLLLLKFELYNKKVFVIIDDNGIGLTKSQEIKTKNQKVHESRGMTNTKERIALLNDLYKKGITFEITEKTAPKSSLQGEQAKQTGTIVTITFPLINRI